MNPDWKALATEYVQTGISLKELGAKYGAPLPRVKQRCAAEHWVQLRSAWRQIAAVPALPPQVSETRPSPRTEEADDPMIPLEAIRAQLTVLLARAAGELDKQVLVHKSRRKEVTYDDAQGKGKPVEETVEENLRLEVVDALVNCMGLQHLSNALKTLREVAQANAGSAVGTDRVAELMRRLDEEAATPGEGANAFAERKTT